MAESNSNGMFTNGSLNRQQLQSGKSDKNAAEKEIIKLQLKINALKLQGEKDAAEIAEAELKKALEKKKAAQKEIDDATAKIQDEINKKNKEALKKGAEEAGQKVASALVNGLVTIKGTLDETMSSFVKQQESMAYGLRGTSADLTSVTKAFTKALGSTGVVKQEAVYSKLSDLITQGIIYNAEQRAYLGTLAKDLGMVFDPTEGTLTRLINLQRQDLSDERMAIEYSLKEFLNQNYQTSQYIKEGFQDVSNALVEAQSLMTATNAMTFEASVQKWLGSMSSAGASSNTVNALATAIGQLGSGDLSVLSGGMLPLLAMAASSQGLSIGELLTGGLNSSNTNSLLAGVAQYASSIYGSSSNNVVLSELGKAFGISNVSDLKALAQTGNVSNVTLGTNINTLLNEMDNYLYKSTKIENTLANFMYSWAVNTASSDTNYLVYKITDVISQATAAMLNGTTITAGILGNGVELNLSQLIQATPLLTTLPGLISSIGGVGKAFTSSGSALSIYQALANGGLASTKAQRLAATGNWAGLSNTSGTNTSGSLVYFNPNTTDVGTTVKTSALQEASALYEGEEEQKTINDVYELLETFKTTSFGTYARIAESDNTVTIGNDMTLISDMITFGALNIQNIYAFLIRRFGGAEEEQKVEYDLDQVKWSSPFDWYSSAANLNLTK